MAFPQAQVVEPVAAHNMTAILLAGRGSYAVEFAEELTECKTSEGKSLIEHFPGCRWVVLGAPERDTVFGLQPEWFELASTSTPHAEGERQVAGLRDSVMHVRSIIDIERAHIPASKIIFGGISQGFAVASHVMVSSGYNLVHFWDFVDGCLSSTS